MKPEPIIFNFNKDLIMENDKIKLIPLSINHFDDLKIFLSEEPYIWTHSYLPMYNENDLLDYIRSTLQARSEGKEYAFAVFDKVKNTYAGSTRFYDVQLAHHTIQLGYTWYGKEFQGTYLNKNAKYLLLQFAFDELGMQRVEFRASSENDRSIAAMQSIGCSIEGVFRSHLYKPDGSRRSSTLLSILKSEWDYEIRNKLLGQI
jgi:N-acetyltransferase